MNFNQPPAALSSFLPVLLFDAFTSCTRYQGSTEYPVGWEHFEPRIRSNVLPLLILPTRGVAWGLRHLRETIMASRQLTEARLC
jgi:hypothetical protein